MTFSATTILVLALVAALVVAIGFWAYSTANRLDRLHVRTDLAAQALDAALGRRAVVARTVAGALGPGAGPAQELTRLADRAERIGRDERETVENRLSAALAGVDIDTLRPQLVAELADAEARVLIARRFYNDAVRDTLALRTRRPVRVLHLGGTAPMPAYFEIAERVELSASTGLALTVNRTSARVVVLDREGRALLLRGRDPKVPDVAFWFTVGGGVQPGESLREAAVREVFEETGRRLGGAELRGPIWRRVAVFPFDGELIRSEELFFAWQTSTFDPVQAHFTEQERRAILGHSWCTAQDIVALTASGEQVYPYELDELLPEARTAAQSTDDGVEVRSIR